MVAAALAFAAAYGLRFGLDEASLNVLATAVPYGLVTLVLIGVWLCVMFVSGSYGADIVGYGSAEYERVVNGGIRFLALIATVAFAFKVDLARGFVAVFLPTVMLLTVAGRWSARRWLHGRRAAGECCRRVIVTGNPVSAYRVARHLERSLMAGYQVVGVCVEGTRGLVVEGRSIPILGSPDQVLGVLEEADADVLIIAGALDVEDAALQRLSWQLEGTGIELVVAPPLTDVAGPRVTVRPLAGLPLMTVEEPQLTGFSRFVKALADRIVGTVLFALASPVLVVLCLAVKCTSRGPVFFQQERVGVGGRTFTMFKFRTMVVNAEAELVALLDQNEHDGPLFKIRDDPRRTAVGKVLRRYSLDELPQLWHVVRGYMSLVGPRPPLPAEVAQYDRRAARRLLVKPGMTGLWQVSGRADLSWQESVRLDLYYVENWSLGLDTAIVGKTISAVLRGRGAY
jgi:exopolysaccharide biosynthesis polyprenyl glycosylphosphotransferase